MNSSVQQLAKFINSSHHIVVFTGAGISTESGISDYRSKGGIWQRFHPVTIQEFLNDGEKRKEYWRQKKELFDSLKDAQPNVGHKAIFQLERLGKLKGIITQNIDGLHQLAGNSPNHILEIHGSNREILCLSCGDLRPWQEVYQRLKTEEDVPLCDMCEGFLKPNTISFGQALNPLVLNTACQWAAECDLFLAVGSTLVVEPAASIPKIAKQAGTSLVIITLSETPLDTIADLKIETGIGEVLTKALQFLESKTA